MGEPKQTLDQEIQCEILPGEHGHSRKNSQISFYESEKEDGEEG